MKGGLPWTWWIAFKFWQSKKAHSIIQIVQSIAFWGIVVSSAALLVILSAFNGLEELVTRSLNEFHASVRLEPKTGRYVHLSTIDTSFFTTPLCASWTPVLEDMAIAQYNDQQQVVMIKGVNPDRGYEKTFTQLILQGEPVLQQDSMFFAWMGIELANQLHVFLGNMSQPLLLYAPSSRRFQGSTFSTEFNSLRILPSAFFSAEQRYDKLYVIVPYAFAQQLFDRPKQCSAIDVFAAPGVSDKRLKKYLSERFGEEWHVKTRFEQEEAIYKIIKTERFMVVLLLSFIVLITSFTLSTTLTLTLITRNRDLSMLWALGATLQQVRGLIIVKGMIITLGGIWIGLIMGTMVVFLQQKFGLVTFETSTDIFVSNIYPVKLIWTDYVLIFLVVSIIGLVLSVLSARQLQEKDINLRSYAV